MSASNSRSSRPGKRSGAQASGPGSRGAKNSRRQKPAQASRWSRSLREAQATASVKPPRGGKGAAKAIAKGAGKSATTSAFGGKRTSGGKTSTSRRDFAGKRDAARMQPGRDYGYKTVRGHKPDANRKSNGYASDSLPQRDYLEGRRATFEALEVGLPLKRAYVAEAGDPTLAGLIEKLQAAGVECVEVPRARLDSMSSHGAHQGVVVECAPFAYAELADILERATSKQELVVVLDHITDEGNFGAIVRSAEVVGAAGVIIPKARSARVGTAAYKTSAGAVLHVPIAQVANLATTLDELKAEGFWVAGSTEHATESVWEAPLTGRIALVMGSEGSGISRLVLEKCDFTCKLPQKGQVESLNVAQATTVMCYEWLRRSWGQERE